MENQRTSVIDDLSDTIQRLLEVRGVSDETRREVIKQGLRKAYLAGVEMAAQGMMLANALDAEEADTMPAPPLTHDHASPRDLIEAALEGTPAR